MAAPLERGTTKDMVSLTLGKMRCLLYRIVKGRNDVCDIGAMLPLWKATVLRECYFRGWNQSCSSWFCRPQSVGLWKKIHILREHGVCATENILREECDRLNEVFFHYIQTKRPFVVMKCAMKMVGKMAAYTGGFQMGYRRNGKKSCTAAVPPVQCHYSRRGNGTY